MKLYRAIPQAEYRPEQVHTRGTTLRAPSNVPYLVDNLWEYLRPDYMPSRRHAVYASPTAELALANASAHTDSGYLACTVDITGQAPVVQLSVKDARYHEDVRRLPHMVMAVLGKDFSLLPLATRTELAPLFMPYMRKEDLEELATTNPTLRLCLNKASDESTFWPSASVRPDASSSGELFFELLNNASYQLKSIVVI